MIAQALLDCGYNFVGGITVFQKFAWLFATSNSRIFSSGFEQLFSWEKELFVCGMGFFSE